MEGEVLVNLLVPMEWCGKALCQKRVRLILRRFARTLRNLLCQHPPYTWGANEPDSLDCVHVHEMPGRFRASEIGELSAQVSSSEDS